MRNLSLAYCSVSISDENLIFFYHEIFTKFCDLIYLQNSMNKSPVLNILEIWIVDLSCDTTDCTEYN